MIIRRIFLVGASGVGKTTLAQAVAPRLGLPYYPVSASEGYRRHGTTPEAAFRDAPLMAKVQATIADYTAEALEDAPAGGFITDRAFDLSVYGSLLGCPHPKPKVDRVLYAMRRRPANRRDQLAVTVVLIRPEQEVTRLARAADGGRRHQFLTDEWVYRLDGALCHFLRASFIPHVELPAGTVSLTDRRNFVEAAARTTIMEETGGWVDPDGAIW